MIDFVISVLIPSITIIAIVGTQLVLEGSTPTSAHFLLGPRLAVTALVLCISTTLLKLGENLTALRVSAASELNLAYIHELNDLVQYKLGIMLGAIAVYVAQMVAHYQHYRKMSEPSNPAALAIYGTTLGFIWLAVVLYVARLSPGA